MPSFVENTDQLDVWTRYVIWAREPFSWPISAIHGLNFPFYDASITRGPIPFFALIFKLLSRINVYFSDFYYFPFIEMLFVFFSAYFTCILMDSFKSRDCLLKIAGSVLVGLSFPLLYRSSNYYGVTYFVLYVPLYLGFAYYYKRLYDETDRKSLYMLLIFLSILTLMFEHYVLFGIYFLLLVCLICCIINNIYNNNRVNVQKVIYSATALAGGMISTLIIVYILGNQGDIDLGTVRSASPLMGRFNTDWGYGGGFGGGFHVADVLTLIIPPKYQPNLASNINYGPSSILTEIGFPLTTNNLQAGQYEGFSYLGTAALVMVCIILIASIFLFLKKRKEYISRIKFIHESSFRMKNELIQFPAMMALSTLLLFILSWGYIIHIGGIRINELATPSFILALMWPKFMFVRSMGRLAIPFMLFITIAVIIIFGKILNVIISKNKPSGIIIYGIIIIAIITCQIYEIRGYLEPPKAVVYGNDLSNEFMESDVLLLKRIVEKKDAIIAVPTIRKNYQWLKICYSLAYLTKVPINGSYSGLGVNQEHLIHDKLDIDNILSGKIRAIVNKYGNIVIAAPPDIAERVMQLTDTPLKLHRLKHQQVVIMTL